VTPIRNPITQGEQNFNNQVAHSQVWVECFFGRMMMNFRLLEMFIIGHIVILIWIF
jgi:hypothetical protein